MTTADITDHLSAIQICQIHAEVLEYVKNMLFVGAYTGKSFAQVMKATLGCSGSVEAIKRSELHKFAVLPKRRVIERTVA
ncbi:hypothetical protein P4278_26905 [Bacillus thuringiensis]|nr:hypothetical protein [Bacillus thuringiensis]MED2783293.1 hypothetical protein [Bacillus thuringiensis]